MTSLAMLLCAVATAPAQTTSPTSTPAAPAIDASRIVGRDTGVSGLIPPPKAADAPPQRDAIGSVVFYGPNPNYATPTVGSVMTNYRQFEDFNLTSTTRVQSVRFWTIQSTTAVWDGSCFYEIYADGGGFPTGQPLALGLVALRRTNIGTTSDNFIVHQNDFDIPSILLTPSRYWLSLRMSVDCTNAATIGWIRGTPSFGYTGQADGACDGGLVDTALDHAFRLFGAVGSSDPCVDLEHPTIAPFFTNESNSSTQIGASDRAVAVQMNNTVSVTALGVLMQVGQADTLVVKIRSLSGTTLGNVVAQAQTNVDAGSVGFSYVPINFTFSGGQRYDISFNMAGGWGVPSAHVLEFYNFDNPTLSAGLGYNAGAFKVLDGRSGDDGYANSVMPHLSACVVASYEAYGLDVQNQKLVGFNLATPQVLANIAALPYGTDWTGLDFKPGAGLTTLYVLDNTFDRLRTINAKTGLISDIGPLTANGADVLTGLTFDRVTGNLYASGTISGTRSTLYRVNPLNGASTVLGTTTLAKSVIGLAASGDGTIYAIDILTDSLYTLNKTNGTATLVGSLGFDINFTQGIDFDSATGILYGALVKNSTQSPGLYTIDTQTGAATLIGQFGTTYPGLANGVPTLSSLAVAKDATPAPSPTPTPSASPTSSRTPTISLTPSSSPTVSLTPSISLTPSFTPSPSLTPSLTPSPTPFNGSTYFDDSAPQAAPPGEKLLFGVKVQNAGSTTWNASSGYSLAVTADPCGLLDQPFGRVALDSGLSIGPGEVFQFIVPIIAPSPAASCSMQFRMVQEFVEFFGPTISVTVTSVNQPNAAADWELYE